MRSSRGWGIGGLGVVAVLVVAGAPGRAGEPVETAVSELAFPLTFERVWYRTGDAKGLFGRRDTGNVTLSEQGILFAGAKTDRLVPLGAVRMTALGTMRGDPDTEWVVLTVEEGGRRGRVGFRDGKRFGYGGRTEHLHVAVLELMRRTDTGMFAAPEGFEPYTELAAHFALVVPEGWSSWHREVVYEDTRPAGGVLVFTPEPLVGPGETSAEARERAGERIARGESTAWVVVRRPAEPGMGCDGFTDAAAAHVAAIVAGEPLFAGDWSGPGPTAFAPATLDGCAGLASAAVGGEGASAPAVEIRAVSDGTTLFVFGLRTVRGRLEADRAAFARGLDGFRATPAYPAS